MVEKTHEAGDASKHSAGPVEPIRDIEKGPKSLELPPLGYIESHLSHHELHGAVSHHTEANAAQYERFSEHRKIVITAGLFFAFSIGTALAPNLVSYFIFRIFTAFQGTSFLIVGTSCLGDIYTPTKRATALGLFLSGALVGPAFGPFVGGIIVTYRTWRDIFWLQSALGGLATVLVFQSEE
jgi:Major Facilitator Superfamily